MFKFFKKNKPEEIKTELKKTPTHVAILWMAMDVGQKKEICHV